MGYHVDNVRHSGNVLAEFQHFRPGYDAVDGQNAGELPDPKRRILVPTSRTTRYDSRTWASKRGQVYARHLLIIRSRKLDVTGQQKRAKARDVCENKHAKGVTGRQTRSTTSTHTYSTKLVQSNANQVLASLYLHLGSEMNALAGDLINTTELNARCKTPHGPLRVHGHGVTRRKMAVQE